MTAIVEQKEITSRLEAMAQLPVAMFGSTMGLSGLAIAWRLSHAYFGTPLWLGEFIGYIAIFSFLAMTVAYGIKLIKNFDKVRNEFNHPISGNLFGTILISLLLLPILLADINLFLARAVWMLGAVGMTVFAWWVVSRWMHVRQQIAHASPAWVIPVVGMIDVPLAIPSLQLDSMHGIMIFALAIGLFFTIPLFTMIFSRLIFEEPMQKTLQPSYMILVAPFSVGFSSYVTTVGRVDLFAEALFMLMLFIMAVLAGRLRNLVKSCPFHVSWWSVSFPIAASSTAALRYARDAQNQFADGIAIFFLAFATIVILGLLVRTVFAIIRGELRTLKS
jgi:tellurite resistance protein